VKISVSELAGITGGTLTGPGTPVVSDILTDSRIFTYSEGLAFFAIRGPNHDGHNFIARLAEGGLKIFVADHVPADFRIPGTCSFILVRDTIEALQLLAKHIREQFKGRVIAVTGSTGKTIVKEWLSDVMGASLPVIRSPKSYNSQLGVPLSVIKLNEGYNTGIFEAGISKPGEMARLESIIKPDTGVITNIGEAHSENFRDLRQKAAEKLELFRNCTTIIYCSDYEVLNDLIRKKTELKDRNMIDWSFDRKKAFCKVKSTRQSDDITMLELDYNGKIYKFGISLHDRASVENAITVAVTCLACGINPDLIGKGLKNLVPVAMRMEIKTGINGCTIIADYYNSDPGSLGMAVEYLVTQQARKKALILSDFIQSGRNEPELYGEVADLLKRKGVDRFVGIGEALLRNKNQFSGNCSFYRTTDEFLSNYSFIDLVDEAVLIKGARIFEFEKISRRLEQQVHQTVLEISLDAIAHNLNTYRQIINPGTRIMAMVKAFAYGAGAAETASLLEYHRIDYLAVAIADEGADLRRAGVALPVVVMNPEPAAFDLMIKYSLEPEIYNLRMLRLFSEAASRHGLLQFPVHIKIDSGMHRLGFMEDQLEELIKEINSAEGIKVASVFSHLSASEDPSLDSFTRKQAELFLRMTDRIREATGQNFLRHILNSAGIVRFPEYQFEMVRPGIGLYGINTVPGINLKPSGRYLTRISQVKKIPAGDPVGYGCTDKSGSDRIIAILPVGYADGLDRRLGNRKGSLFIKGKKVPIVGNICMDMCMADVTGLDAREGDDAEIFGMNISVDEVAVNAGTIPYEILTSIPSRVKRVFYRD